MDGFYAAEDKFMITYIEWKQIQEGKSKKDILDTLARIRGGERKNVDWQSQPRSSTFEIPGRNPKKNRKEWKAKINKGDLD